MTSDPMIDGYRIIAPFKSGSMAELHRVETPTGERALLKRPKLGFGSHPACYAGFETEQVILERLSGMHTPRCLTQGEDTEGPYLIFEHIEGAALEDIAAGAPLPAGEVARLGGLIATALHELHRQNVVHHDLTPAHVLLHDTRDAVLIDFGLACHGDLPDLAAVERDDALGTPAIIAPEQLLGKRGDPRSDLYALGAILYRLATGHYPFGLAQNIWDLQRRRWFDPLPPRHLNPAIPEWLQEVILHCLAVRPERRYATAAQIAQDLAHPEQIVVGARSMQARKNPILLALQRWWAEQSIDVDQAGKPVRQLDRAPHLLVAIDTTHHDEPLAAALRATLRRMLAHDPHWRVSCIGVMESSIITEQEESAELSRSLHTDRLSALHQWAYPLALPREKARFHVITGSDTATAIVDYARSQHVDHIVMGARASSSLRRFLGSVSVRVVAEAPCSVTVVRTPQLPATPHVPPD